LVWVLFRLPRSEEGGEEGGFAIEVGREGGREGESAWSGLYTGYPEVKEAARKADLLLR